MSLMYVFNKCSLLYSKVPYFKYIHNGESGFKIWIWRNTFSIQHRGWKRNSHRTHPYLAAIFFFNTRSGSTNMGLKLRSKSLETFQNQSLCLLLWRMPCMPKGLMGWIIFSAFHQFGPDYANVLLPSGWDSHISLYLSNPTLCDWKWPQKEALVM